MIIEDLKLLSDEASGKHTERNLVNSITRTELLTWFHKNEYSDEKIEFFFNDKKLTPQEQEEINDVLRQCKIETGIKIYEILVYLDDYIATPNKLIQFLDEETLLIIKRELSKKYNILVEENNLKDIFND